MIQDNHFISKLNTIIKRQRSRFFLDSLSFVLTFSIILTIIGVVALVTGITFAIYENTINSNKSQIIKTGVVNFTLTETTNGLILNNLQELSDYEGMAQETVETRQTPVLIKTPAWARDSLRRE